MLAGWRADGLRWGYYSSYVHSARLVLTCGLQLILLAKGYKSLEDEARNKAAQADEELSGTMARLKLSEEKVPVEGTMITKPMSERSGR